MMTPFNEALMLMAVGMGTVFVALLLIIYCSKFLISSINRWFPEELKPSVIKKISDISPKTIAVITAAVAVASKGKARIVEIQTNK